MPVAPLGRGLLVSSRQRLTTISQYTGCSCQRPLLSTLLLSGSS